MQDDAIWKSLFDEILHVNVVDVDLNCEDDCLDQRCRCDDVKVVFVRCLQSNWPASKEDRDSIRQDALRILRNNCLLLSVVVFE